MKAIQLNQKTGELLLAAVIMARATSFLFSKLALQSMQPMTLMAVRFLLAFGLLALLFHKQLRQIRLRTLFRGMALGGIFFLVLGAELSSLQTTPSSTVSFLENTAIVFVPIFESVLHRRLPRLHTVFSLLITIFGVALLTLGDSAFTIKSGELLALLAAVLYAVAIILTDRLSRQGDSFVLGILQVGFMGIFALIAAFLFETPRLPVGTAEWSMILMLAIVCSGFGFTLQPVAQSHTTAERAAMLCALNPATAAVLGWIFLQESFGVTGFIAVIFILAGILIATSAKENKS